MVLNPDAASDGLTYLRKLNMQLASKMRFVSAQLIALLRGRPVAALAPATPTRWPPTCGRALEAGIADGALPGVGFSQPTQSNAVFATLPHGAADRLRARFRFYDWDAAKGEVRWMCGFDTTRGDVDAFVAALKEELAA